MLGCIGDSLRFRTESIHHGLQGKRMFHRSLPGLQSEHSLIAKEGGMFLELTPVDA